MGKEIICFSLGLSEEEIEKGIASFRSISKEPSKLEVISIAKYMLNTQVGEILDGVNGLLEFNDTGKCRNEEEKLSADDFK